MIISHTLTRAAIPLLLLPNSVSLFKSDPLFRDILLELIAQKKKEKKKTEMGRAWLEVFVSVGPPLRYGHHMEGLVVEQDANMVKCSVDTDF